ncbi:hypothetical protein MLD38_027552 [Melastoma candidum]|uniref:Uncharacterized protein n=1 Tax=Melastoma candidum TaxID=119954 RepID=A0ACB9P5B6_9MYRT|nr:hypothetical protein MLD38_027552 [Melastoma candidum]
MQPVAGPADEVRKAVEENPVIVIGRRGCCMCHVAYRLLLGIGVNPAVHEVGEAEEGDVVGRLREMTVSGDEVDRGAPSEIQFPAVFVGGRLFGGLDKVMTCHISGELEPVLRKAGALWL